MAKLIVEVLTRNGVHFGYHKMENFPVHIGRALDNDIVLADPYLSSYHLVIEEGDEGWIVTDQHSANGTQNAKGQKITGPAELKSGDLVFAGKTALRLLSPAHPVPPALRIQPRRGFALRAAVPAFSFVSILVTLGFMTFLQFLNTSRETKPIALVATAIPFLSFPLLWAGAWACAGFIIRRKASYGAQLLVANGGFILIFVLTALTEYIDFSTNSNRFSDIFQYVAMALLSAAVLFSSLKVATGAADLRRAVITLAIGGGIIGAIALIDRAENADDRIAPVYSRTLKPPYAKLAPSVTLDEFIKDSERLFVKKNAKTTLRENFPRREKGSDAPTPLSPRPRGE